jgi:hypothetical protein
MEAGEDVSQTYRCSVTAMLPECCGSVNEGGLSSVARLLAIALVRVTASQYHNVNASLPVMFREHDDPALVTLLTVLLPLPAAWEVHHQEILLVKQQGCRCSPL